MITQYKFLRSGLRSQNGNLKWKLNKWVKVKGELDMCQNGLHSSVEPYDAFSYVQGEVVALVECRGEHLEDDNKYCWREQRVIKTRRWTKKDSVKLAIYSAEQVIGIYEKYNKTDKRPRKAIQAAKKWLKHPTEKNRYAAATAATYAATYTAANAATYAAANAATYAATAAAYAATYAATAAAYAAAYAANAAYTAATYAANAAAYTAATYAATAAAYAVDAADARKLLIGKIQKYFKRVIRAKGL
jgi:hypothetical protein